jgi:hypothetical protein
LSSSRSITLAGLFAVVVALFLGAANLYFGELNQDEGWYLYAAREVAHGLFPYKDFAFTQAPLLPFVYALATPLVGSWGVGGGRLFTLAMGLACALLAARLAGRLAPDGVRREAAWIAFALAAVNVYQSYFTTIVKTYALCGLFLAAGFLVFSFVTRKGTWGAAFLAGALLACAAGTRISSGAALAVGGFYLLFNRKHLGDVAWLAFGIGGGLGLAAIFLPWFFAAREGFLFGVFEYHSLRSAGGIGPAVVYKCGFISRLVQAFYPAAALAVVTALLYLVRRPPSEPKGGPRPAIAVWITVALISLVHFSAPFPYDDYQVPLYPLFCAALAAALCRWLASLESGVAIGGGPLGLRVAVVWMVVLVSTAAAFSSPINQNWMILGRDRIWWKVRAQAPLKQLRDVAFVLRQNTGEGGELLTQDTYLAIEAGLRVPKGLEMGPFSYYADWPRERAEAIHVVNEEMMLELIATNEARIAAVSGYGLSVKSPDVVELEPIRQDALWRALRARYAPMFEVPNFGQGATTLRVLEKRDSTTNEHE